MFCYGRFMLLAISLQVWVFLLKRGNGQSYQPWYDENRPFRRYYHDGKFMVKFPSIPALQGVNLLVRETGYNETDVLYTGDPEYCLARLFLQRHLYNSSNILPLKYPHLRPQNVTFFNCSSAGSGYASHSCPILALGSHDSVLSGDLVSCTMILRLRSPIPAEDLQENNLRLKWIEPARPDYGIMPTIKVIYPGTVPVVLALVLIVFVGICIYVKKKRDDQSRLGKFLADYKALKPTRFSYADIKRITGQFKHKLGEGAHGTVFKGKLSSEVQVAVKVLNSSDRKDFINEVGTMGKIHHINVVRLLGFCAEGLHCGLVYDFFPNGSLQKFITSPEKENFLGWLKLQQIALDIAKGIEYLHQGCDHRILHFDINPRNVLLDDNFIPKISDFGLAKLCSKNQSMVSMTAARGTIGYIAPEVFSQNFGHVTYKSDIYSYGILLLEMVGGRKNIDTDKEAFQVLYPEWIHNLIEGGDISIYMDDEVDLGIAKKLAIIGVWCIQWHSINRPSMKTVIQMIEGEVDKLKVPPTPFDFTASTNSSAITPTRHLNLELDAIHE